MKYLTLFAALFALSLTASADPADKQPLNTSPEPALSGKDFVELFNGKNLNGWVQEGGDHRFEVKDGAIVGTCVPGEANGFLCTKATYSDFVFTTEFKWEEKGNSGVMFRADTKDSNDRVFGYQAEMDPGGRRWTGGIYGEAMGGWKYPLKGDALKDARQAVRDHFEWNRLTIKAEGNVIKTWINGVPVAHLVNDERENGFFGLQVHSGKKGTIHWRKLKVKELSVD
ncbi:DUF1080 domain-containing protein [Coraliomargarita sinensis]|uniref:DUF1080 domain-containing protein n=1 Tax=Coraliomargarita sinensis TaxID=2174842 RepID=A0A317ZHH1_9BACT|nr:DUF1080 domain-containing protein [Coraliomargarita sinensis]PXA04422.1 DUF1080 domain-containing protein [Coraliomargarita sinensis]